MNGTKHLTYMLIGGAVVFGVLLLIGTPLQSALLLGVLLACPLMMVFMMGGHGSHGADNGENRTGADRRNERDGRAGLGGHRH